MAQADPADGLVVRRGEQGVRPAVPLRRARGRADPAGHAGRADAGRRLGHPGVLHRDRRRHPGGRGRPAVEVRRRTATWSLASPAEGDPRLRDRTTGDKEYVLEEAIVADFGLVRAWKGDRHGNLVYRESARNFNPLAAMCGRVTIAEVEHLVEPGEIDPDDVHTPGRLRAAGGRADARSRRRTSGSRSGPPVRGPSRPRRRRAAAVGDARGRRLMAWTREEMAAAGGLGADRRLLRQPRHRAADAGAELRRRRRRAGAAVGERHPRRRRLPVRGRGGPRPDQRRQGDRDAAARGVVLRLRDVVRDDPRRQDRRRDPRRDAGLGDRRHRQLDDPRARWSRAWAARWTWSTAPSG